MEIPTVGPSVSLAIWFNLESILQSYLLVSRVIDPGSAAPHLMVKARGSQHCGGGHVALVNLMWLITKSLLPHSAPCEASEEKPISKARGLSRLVLGQ